MNIINSNITFNGLKYGNNPKEFIIHHAQAKKCTVYDIDRWHKNKGWSGIGYHFFIDKDGKVWTGRPESGQGAHTINHNTKSLGICLEGDFMVESPTTNQLKSLNDLINYLKRKYGNLPIYRHKDLNPTDCPGENFVFNNINNESEGGKMGTYKNGSTIEPVYSDSDCTNRIGSLDKYEECICYGKFEDKAIVLYKVNGTNNEKIGFVKWLGGIK